MLANEIGSPVLASRTTPESCPVVPDQAVPKRKTAPARTKAAPRTLRGRKDMLASSVDPLSRQNKGFIPEQIGRQSFDLDLFHRSINTKKGPPPKGWPRLLMR